MITNGARSGYIRIKATAGGFAEVSVALTEDAQGKGAGAAAIRAAIGDTAANPALLGWRALVDARNTRSIRAFAAAGFSHSPTFYDGEGIFLILERCKK